MPKTVLPMFPSKSFIVWALHLGFSSILSLFLYMVLWETVVIFFFDTLLSSFPSSTYWQDCLNFVTYFVSFVVLIDHRYVSLFPGFLFCSIDLCVCFCISAILLWLLLLSSSLIPPVAWFLQFCFSLSRFFSYLGSLVFLYKFNFYFVLFPWEVPLIFWLGWHWIWKFPWVLWSF